MIHPDGGDRGPGAGSDRRPRGSGTFDRVSTPDFRRFRRFAALLISLAAVAAAGFAFAACGGSSDEPAAKAAPTAADFPSARGKTIEQVLTDQTPADLVVAPAGSVFEVGKNRYPFGVFEVDRTEVDDAEVALYFAKSPTSKVQGPLPAKVVSLSTRPAYRSQGAAGPGEATSFYVTDVRFSQPGPWHAIALIRKDGGYGATRVPSPNVGSQPRVIKPGQKAPDIKTPTAEEVGGDLSKIDTRQPPSSMHDVSLDQVLGKKPVVLVFATPALCQSRVCGPTVDVAEQVKAEVGDGVAFIHNEVYNENDPNKGIRSQLIDFGLQSEPWIFLIGKDGKVRQRFEGPVGVDELRAAVENLKDG